MKKHQVEMPRPIALDNAFDELRKPPEMIDSSDEECAHVKVAKK